MKMKGISFPILSACLISLGAILAVWGVLLENPRDYINASYIGSDRPGMILALSNPTIIENYMRYRNKAFLSLVFIVLGFFVGLPAFANFKISLTQIALLIIVLFILSLIIAGRTRKNIIDKWSQSDCQISWFLKLLDESYFNSQYDHWKKTKQGNEFLENTMSHFNHIAIALDVDIKIKPSYNSLTPEYLHIVRENLRKEFESISVLYYVLKPKKLLNAYK